MQWQNESYFQASIYYDIQEGKVTYFQRLHSARNIWTGNVFLQEKPGSHTEHNVVLVDWTHCQVNLLIINFYIVLQIKLSSNQSILACICLVLPWSILELIRLQDMLTFCTPRPWHKCASGHPIWICLNLKLGVAMLGKEGSFENDLIHSDWHFASIDKMHNFTIPHPSNSCFRHYRNHNRVLCLNLNWWL